MVEICAPRFLGQSHSSVLLRKRIFDVSNQITDDLFSRRFVTQRALPLTERLILGSVYSKLSTSLPFRSLFSTVEMLQDKFGTSQPRGLLHIRYGSLSPHPLILFVALFAIVPHDSFVGFRGHFSHFAEASGAPLVKCSSPADASPVQICTCEVPSLGKTTDYSVVVTSQKNQLMAKCSLYASTVPVDLMKTT